MQSSDEILQGILGGRKKKSPKRSPKRKSPKRSPKRKVKTGKFDSVSKLDSIQGGKYDSKSEEERPWSAVDALIHVPRAAVDVSTMLLSGIVDNRITMKKPQLK